MTLHPQSQAYLDQMEALALAPTWEVGVAAARERGRAGLATVPAGSALPRVEDRTVPGPAGEIMVRVFWPSEETGLPVLVWFHGGGWVLGSVAGSDPVCRRLAEQSRAIVISVDYRMAPEDPAPASFDDCLAVTRWAAEHASEFGGDGSRVAVGGDSAGGNLAAAVALHARDDGGPALAHQLLVYPVADSRMNTTSYDTRAEGFGLGREMRAWFWDQYVPLGGAVKRDDPRVSPAHASDLAGLPRAHVITAEYDPLCDEGDAYAAHLEAAGVAVRHECVAGHLHGFFGNPHIFDAAEASIRDAASELSAAFAEVSARV